MQPCTRCCGSGESMRRGAALSQRPPPRFDALGRPSQSLQQHCGPPPRPHPGAICWFFSFSAVCSDPSLLGFDRAPRIDQTAQAPLISFRRALLMRWARAELSSTR